MTVRFPFLAPRLVFLAASLLGLPLAAEGILEAAIRLDSLEHPSRTPPSARFAGDYPPGVASNMSTEGCPAFGLAFAFTPLPGRRELALTAAWRPTRRGNLTGDVALSSQGSTAIHVGTYAFGYQSLGGRFTGHHVLPFGILLRQLDFGATLELRRESLELERSAWNQTTRTTLNRPWIGASVECEGSGRVRPVLTLGISFPLGNRPEVGPTENLDEATLRRVALSLAPRAQAYAQLGVRFGRSLPPTP